MTSQPQIDAIAVLKSLGISMERSVFRAIMRVTQLLDESTSRLNTANRIIMRLGCSPQKDDKHAELIAKALVEQAWRSGSVYDPVQAIQIAQQKYEKLFRENHFIFVGTTQEPVDPETGESRMIQKRAKKSNDTEAPNDKEIAIRDIYTRLKGTMSNNAIAKQIASELDLTVANVSYYITRKLNKS